MYNDTNSEEFECLSLASVNVSNEDVAAQTAFALSYPTAVVHGNWPKASAFVIPKAHGYNNGLLRFMLKDLAGDAVDNMTAHFKLWGWQEGTSGARLLLHLVLTCGSAVIGTAGTPGTGPVINANNRTVTAPQGTAITWAGQWGYVDTISMTTNRVFAIVDPSAGADNGIAELYFDLIGGYSIFGDWDTDAGAGSTPDDALAIIRGY